MGDTPRLLVAGAVHLDPRGPGLLSELLDTVRPACITVEYSRWGALFRRRRGPELLARLDEAAAAFDGRPSERVDALRAMLSDPYEHRVCREWAAEHGGRVVLVDRSSVSAQRLKALAEVFEPDNLQQLLEDSAFGLSRSAMEQHLLARRYRGDASLFALHFGEEEQREMTERGEGMAKVILGHLRRVEPGVLLHVGGWAHLVRTGKRKMRTLAMRLDDAGVAWRGMLLGDRLPRPFRPEEPEDG